MAQSKKSKRLFKVASEFNVTTQSIVDTLSEEGFEVDNKPNTKVTGEMYSVLEEAYESDKARSLEHEKAREEYQDRRSSIQSSRNESVSVEDFLEPLDDDELADEEASDDLPLDPQEEPLPLKPGDDESDEEQGDEVEESDKQTEEEVVVEEQEAVQDSQKKTEEPEPELEAEAKADDDAHTTETDEDPETAAEQKPEQTEAQDEKPKSEDAAQEPTKAKKESESDSDSDIETEPVSEEKKQTSKQDEPEPEKETEKQSAEAKAGETKVDEQAENTETKTDTDTDTDSGEASDQEDKTKEEEDDGIIRGRAGKLKGTKVVGKVKVGKDKSRKKRKKRKRRKKRTSKKDDSKKKSGKKKSKSKKRKSRKRKRIDEDDVEEKLQETLQKMQQSESVGQKRQKRRKQRREEREEELKEQKELEELEGEILEVTEFITVNDLAEHLDVGVNDVITTCMNLGMMVSINQRLDASTIELVAEEFGREVEFVDADEAIEEIEIEEDDPEDLKPRAPIVTVMGHVDHGKTSLLDYIRKAKVASGEAGGITQHIGAYEVKSNGKSITFLDTPGHEAFTAMRSRGAQATDVVILVVAADDSVMPQTIEAINHSKAAGVSIVVAINKMDKEGANPDKIKQQLAEHDVIVEEYGGENQVAEVSAITGDGIDELLEKVLIEAELLELQANPDRRADGIVLETHIDKGKGIVANVLVQNGQLKIGDPFVAGPCFGRVRAMENEWGERVEQVGPSSPIQLTGFDEMPKAGDKLVVAEDEKAAKEVANQRKQIRREQEMRKTKHLTLDDLSRRMALGEVSELNLIIKADVDGSIEALSGALQKLKTDEVAVSIIHTGAGAITESDVLLASASDAIIIGFQVRPTSSARKLAENEEIDIRLFSVIYDAVDEVHDALEGMLSPEIKENIIGQVDVRETFKVPGAGMVAGCYVTEGKVKRKANVRLVREGVVIYDGEIDSLKRFKDDVKEVASGYECGVSIVNYNDIKVGDVIEVYEMTEHKRKLVTDTE